MWSWTVTDQLGSNGVAATPGYVDPTAEDGVEFLHGMAEVPSGAGGMTECLFIVPTDAPGLDVDQEPYLSMLPRTAYFMGTPAQDDDFETGYWAVVTIEYDDDALAAAIGDEWEEREPFLTPRVWGDPDGPAAGSANALTPTWYAEPLSHVIVDTEHNTVSFRVDGFHPRLASDNPSYPYFALFSPKAGAPVAVSSYWPSSVKYGRWFYTDADPVIVTYLNARGTEPIRANSIEVWIDGQLWAAQGGNWTDKARGSGSLTVTQANEDATIYEVVYRHSYRGEDWLTPGWHTLDVRYEDTDGLGDKMMLPEDAPGAKFYVDMTPPVVRFKSGFVGNPLFRNVAGYVGNHAVSRSDMLTVDLFDGESGVFVRPDHPEWAWDWDCTDNLPPDPRHTMNPDSGPSGSYPTHPDSVGCWTEVDYGIKYDLWLVEHGCMECGDDEDDQADIDEIEERLLLHQGTADELVDYLCPPLSSVTSYDDSTSADADDVYDPTDTLSVGLPIVGGGLIEDGDILEVTLYSMKSIEMYNDSTYTYWSLDTLWVGDDYVLVWGDHYIDQQSQEMHIYHHGIIDYARNVGSDYVEQRFIVDMTPPTATIVSPADGYAPPGRAFTLEVALDDAKSGVGGEGTVLLLDGDGETVAELTPEDGLYTAHLEDGLDFGTYSIKVNATDGVGNRLNTSLPLMAMNRTLTLEDAYIFPNPYNPNEGYDARIHLLLGRDANVTVKVYDFAGEYVTTLAANERMAAGENTDIIWSGQAADGTPLANGAYMIRAEAKDGSTTKGATIKAVIWRED